MKQDLILLGGKAYEECEVIMLSTKKINGEYENSNICRRNSFGEHAKEVPEGTLNYLKDLNSRDRFNNLWTPQHLYILRPFLEAQDNDWLLNIKYSAEKPEKSIPFQKNFKYDSNDIWYRKIIATTNSSLLYTPEKDKDFRGSQYEAKYQLPRPSNEFLMAYCKANGGIKKVYVEYDRIEIETLPVQIEYNLKVAQDNTITIKKVELSVEEAAEKFFEGLATGNKFEANFREYKEAFKGFFTKGVEWRNNNPKKTYTIDDLKKAFYAGREEESYNLDNGRPALKYNIFEEWIENNL